MTLNRFDIEMGTPKDGMIEFCGKKRMLRLLFLCEKERKIDYFDIYTRWASEMD